MPVCHRVSTSKYLLLRCCKIFSMPFYVKDLLNIKSMDKKVPISFIDNDLELAYHIPYFKWVDPSIFEIADVHCLIYKYFCSV